VKKLVSLSKALTFKNCPKSDTKEQLVNAGILAGLTFFTTLAGVSVSGLMAYPIKGLLSAGISAAVAFFTRLAIERKLK